MDPWLWSYEDTEKEMAGVSEIAVDPWLWSYEDNEKEMVGVSEIAVVFRRPQPRGLRKTPREK